METSKCHEMQHPDPPTWCIHCGTFDHCCRPEEPCPAVRDGRFDTRVERNFNRILAGMIRGQS